MADPQSSDSETNLSARARRVLPGGGFGNLSFDFVVREGRGARVWDESGKEYIDYLLGSGPMLVGHAHPEVLAAVQDARGIALAEEIVAAVACAEKVRFTSSGSEATLYAMRAARAFRGRDKILKFEGGFHGMNDYALMSMAPKREVAFPQALPDSAGIPEKVPSEVLIAPFNDAETTVAILRKHHDELAGAIVEPFQRLVPPVPGFLEALREATAELGVLLIFDEVVTGFRFAYGGAQEYYGVVPDLCAMGKVIGGGFPLAAVGGRADIMAHFDPGAVSADGYMTQIGTLSGNPVAAAAGLATLEILRRPGAYEQIFATGRELIAGIEGLLKGADIDARVIGEPPLFDVLFSAEEARDYRGTARADGARLKRFNALLRERGVLKGDSKFYVSLAHTGEDVGHTLDAVAGALEEL
jgi:glutamate-1-semialdehyde 2,1-aminomutase